jgi:hypothetical protein
MVSKMKNIEVSIKGNSLLAYVTFYNDNILVKLNEMDESEYDFIDFSSAHEKKSVFLGRGFCEDGSLSLGVSVDGEELFHGGIYQIDYEDAPVEEIKEQFQADYGDDEEYEKCLVARQGDCLDAENYFFVDASKFKYCSLEIVECYKSTDTISIEVDDDFTLSELKLVLLDVDTGDSDSITQKLYSVTRLEKQVFGIKYKGKFFEFYGGNDEGGSNEIYWFERNGETWTESEAISERIEELADW